MLMEAFLVAQTPQTAVIQAPPAAPQPALRLDIPHSNNPFNAYRPTLVPQPNLANSPRIDTLVKDGVLELSLKDAIALSLENNLDIAIARYNIPIAAADVLRTQAGGTFRGVNTGVVQNTPGGGVGGFGAARVVQARVERQAGRAAPVRARPGWCSRHWALEQMFRHSTPRSRDS